MANDREILREIWEGKIPVHFQLSSDETDVEPEDFFLLIPRLSYFPLVTEKVRRHFLRVVSNELQDGEMWMDSNGTPLKWHYPIGILCFVFVFQECCLIF
uniref:Autophagy protein 5 n=1 Tax=Culex pipiens TaxID=7175 RepID=A0A8D8GL79_CULPI